MAGPIRIAVLANGSQAKKEIDAVATRGKRFSKGLQVAGRVAAAGLLVVGAAAIKAGQAAAADEQAQSKLAQTLKTAAHASKAQTDQTERYITAAGKQFGITDDALRPSLAKLAVATGSVEKAQRLASIAMDVSTGSGKSLEAVSAALAKAQATGNVAALAKFGVATKDATGKTLSLSKVTQSLADKYKGAASRNAETAAGKQKILAVQLGELQEQIGAKLLPVMAAAAKAGLAAVDWLSKNGTAAKALAIAVGSVAAIILVANVAQKAYTASMILFNGTMAVFKGAMAAAKVAQLAFNIAVALNPIGVIVLGVLALAAGLVLAYKKSDKFRAIVNGAFSAVVNGVKTAVGFVKAKWPLILAILTGPFGLAVLAIAKNWSKIKDGATATKKWITDKFDAALKALQIVAAKIKSALLAPFQAVRDLIQKILDLISKIKIPKLPDLNPLSRISTSGPGAVDATGALATVVLDQSTTVIDSGSRTYQVNITVPVGASLVEAGRQMRAAIDAYESANGRKPVTT